MKVHIIANPVAGGGNGRIRAEALHRALRGRVDDCSLFLTQRAGDAEREASASKAECIASVGGDGTLNEVVNGLAGRDTAIAILSAGTANVVRRELRLPVEAEKIADLILAGHTLWMDAGIQAGRRFLLGAGAGLDAAITAKVSEQRGSQSSVLKWVLPALKVILGGNYPSVRVLVDGELMSDHAHYAIVGICKYSAGVFQPTPLALIDDGKFDVCVLEDLNVWKILRLVYAVARPGFAQRPYVKYRQGAVVELLPAGEQVAYLQVDGDPRGKIPARFDIHPRTVRIVCAGPESVKGAPP